MTEDYESMTVAQLKELLKEQGLPVSGKKSELVARLMESEGVEAPAEEEEAPAATSDDSWDDDEDWDGEDEDVYVVKQKPVLDDSTKEALALRQHKRRKPLPSDVPNGSVTSVLHAQDGEPLTVWTTSNDATTSTEVPLCASVTVRWPPHVSFTPQGLRK